MTKQDPYTALGSDADRVAAYRRGLDEVRGWFDRWDFDAFLAVNQAQDTCGVDGDLLEIGCFEGKSAVLFGMLAGEGENLVVCDIFAQHEGEADPGSAGFYQGFSRERFEDVYRRFHDELPIVEACESSALAHRYEDRQFRIVHVDGSHRYETVRDDIAFASEVTVEGGLIVVDDYRSAHTPGVGAAFWELSSEGRLWPVFLTPFKGYAAIDASGLEVGRRAVATLVEMGHDFRMEEVQGREVWRPIPAYVPREGKDPVLRRLLTDWVPPAMLAAFRRLWPR